MIIALTLSFVLLLVVGMPVAFAIAGSVIASLYAGGIPLTLVPQRYFSQLSSFVLVAVPLFLFAASVMNAGGVTERLINLMRECIGYLRGGLSHASILTNLAMAGVSGSAVADAAGIGRVMIPEMRKEGYTPEYGAAVTAAGAVVAPIIPPSIPFIIAATTAGLSVMDLFLAGIIPGVAMVIAMLVVSFYLSRRRSYPKSKDRIHATSLGHAFLIAVPSLILPVLIVGGVRFGWYTVTEAAGVAAALALFIGAFIHRELTWQKLVDCCIDATRSTGAILLIMGFSSAMSWVISRTRLPDHAVELLMALSSSTAVAIMIIVVFVLLVGTVIEGASGIAILVPLLVPIGVSLGIDPIQMSVIIVVGMMIGLVTPPIGICLFITTAIARTKLGKVAFAVIPFLVVQIAILLLVAYWPAMTLWIPQTFR